MLIAEHYYTQQEAADLLGVEQHTVALLDTGVRSSELVSIELCDVLFDEGRVRVLQGKGRKQRWTAISEVALAALRTYLDDFRGWSEGHLFQTVDGRALRNHHMNVMVTRHGLRARVSQVNPHRFRHTFATWAIRVNARELDVQYLLGHSSPMMVRSLLRDLRLRAGGGARYLQSGDAALGGSVRSQGSAGLRSGLSVPAPDRGLAWFEFEGKLILPSRSQQRGDQPMQQNIR